VFSRFSAVNQVEAGGNQISNIFEVEGFRRWSGGIQFSVNYAYNRTFVDGQDDGDYGISIENPYNRARERSRSVAVLPHRLVIQEVVELPFGKGKRWLHSNRFLDPVVGGWQVTSRWTWSGRQRVTPLWSGVDFSNTNLFFARPDIVPGCNPNVSSQNTNAMFNNECYTLPARGTFGNAERGSLHYTNLPFAAGSDMMLSKDFRLLQHRDQPLRLRTSAFFVNPFNHPYLQGSFIPAFNPNNVVVVNTAGAQRGNMAGNRQISFLLRIEF
jgi:hypothetical protein